MIFFKKDVFWINCNHCCAVQHQGAHFLKGVKCTRKVFNEIPNKLTAVLPVLSTIISMQRHLWCLKCATLTRIVELMSTPFLLQVGIFRNNRYNNQLLTKCYGGEEMSFNLIHSDVSCNTFEGR